MPFDRTNPADLAALKSEVNTDPEGIGYAAVEDNTKSLLDRLNDPSFWPSAPAAETAPLTGKELLDICLTQANKTEFETQVALLNIAQKSLLDYAFANRSKPFDIDFKNNLIGPNGIFPQAEAPNIRGDILAALASTLSRAEVLFGEGTVINRQDWLAARDS